MCVMGESRTSMGDMGSKSLLWMLSLLLSLGTNFISKSIDISNKQKVYYNWNLSYSFLWSILCKINSTTIPLHLAAKVTAHDLSSKKFLHPLAFRGTVRKRVTKQHHLMQWWAKSLVNIKTTPIKIIPTSYEVFHIRTTVFC